LKPRTVKEITICGSGLMGSGIAVLFATQDYRTTIYAVEETEVHVKNKIEVTLNYLYEKGLIEQRTIASSLANIQVTDDIHTATKFADIVIECIPENMELKQNLFKTLDAICSPNVILASNTSVMSITEIASKSTHKERIIGTHFWNPPYLIPLVEVIRTIDTAEEVLEETIRILQSIGKKPIRVNKDSPGFVANRLQHALWREAISIVENGIADAETVDEAIKYSFGLRLPVIGPLENADMVGTDLTLAIHSYIFRHLENSEEPSKILIEKTENNELGFKTSKGFYSWDKEKIQNLNTKMQDHLVDMIKNSKHPFYSK
jgi:3-hydroxybutyryl-CoA dehydrogenase